MSYFRKTAKALLGVDDTPERTALAFAIGVFFGFSPLLGLHTVLGVLIAFLFRLNRMAVLIGVYSNMPWFMPPFYAFATWLGFMILGSEGAVPPGFGLSDLFSKAFWLGLVSNWSLLAPFFLGSTILCVPLSLISYPLSLRFIRSYRAAGPQQSVPSPRPGNALEP